MCMLEILSTDLDFFDMRKVSSECDCIVLEEIFFKKEKKKSYNEREILDIAFIRLFVKNFKQ